MLDLIVNVDRMNDDLPAIRVGMAIAKKQAAFITGLHVVAVYPPIMVMPEAIAQLDTEERQARARSTWWHALCQRHDVKGAWEVVRGTYVPVLAKRSRLADFIITSLPVQAPDSPIGFDNITRTLFADAAPMLLVPDTWQGSTQPERVLIAWNGSGEAADAIKAALPLLRMAGTVRVLDGEIEGLPGVAPPPLPLRQWLSRQGVEVEWQAFHDRSDVGRALLDSARSMDAELLVMGAWGHSRISELILGGATRQVLEQTHLPLLLAH
ncbi:MAG: universal stress protein [Xanthomonadaceae bacterium]|nr:universal stress protein [Xanthomonadaceae bacterium]